eukprot:TRINITY_DN5342_c1_g1_i1.p1 TRINITY_DN5342_c1_g1~~TRINITY_DN5342_c1_g1_i1.p1  ORF type:complete len:418 (-),score=73.12 TRINITY_DN5342_c1_g1_i1:94-1347(-)
MEKILLVSLVTLLLSIQGSICGRNSSIAFGHSLYSSFSLRKGYVNINNGAFGTVCNDAKFQERDYFDMMLADPNSWFRGGYQPYLIAVRQRLAQYVSADEGNLVVVENASAGVNAVFRSLAEGIPLGPGDIFLYMNIAYPMVQNTANYLAKVQGFTVVVVTVTFPVSSDQDFLLPVQNAINQYGSQIKMASFDHISSYPSCILPIKELVQLCHENNIIVHVDGAHVLGQIHLNVTDIGADFYVSNSHKWMYSPTGTAILFVQPKWQSMIIPTVLSAEYSTDFVDKFAYTGTRDYSAFLAIDAAMSFRDNLGDDEIIDYLHNLAWSGGQEVAQIWGTKLVVPVESMNGGLISVILPCTLSEGYAVKSLIFDRYDTFLQLGEINGIPYLRISAQIYLELDDLVSMAHRFLELLKEVRGN